MDKVRAGYVGCGFMQYDVEMAIGVARDILFETPESLLEIIASNQERVES